MYANTTIVSSCFLFAIFIKDCTSSNIYSYLGSKFSSLHDGISKEGRKEVENIFVRSFASDILKDDPICALTAERKKALCELIFRIVHYRNAGIYLNKAGLHLTELPCEEKLLSFKYETDLNDRSFVQKMYPCHGRHERVRTSFIEDNYYDLYYVSGGPDDNSATVYAHSYDNLSGFYVVFDYIHNIDISELRDMLITVKEVTAELGLNKTIISTIDQLELEHIFIREQDYYTNTDPICDLEYERKISLCRIVYNNLLYKNKFRITLNKAAVYLLDMECEKNSVAMRLFDSNSRRFGQRMYPCYARKEPASSIVLADTYLKRFFVSRGPRKNSVFVYVRQKIDDDELFYLIDLLENVRARYLKPTEITSEEVVEESPTTYLKVREYIDAEERKTELAGLLPKSGSTFGKTFETGERLHKRSQETTDEAKNTSRKMVESIPKQVKKLEFKQSEKPEIIEPISGKLTNPFSLETSQRVRIGSQVLKILRAQRAQKAQRPTEPVSKTYFEATISSERLKKKLEERKLAKKGKPTLTEEKLLKIEVTKLIEEMEKSLSIKGTEGKLPEKEEIPGKSEGDVKKSDEKDSTEG